MSANLTSGSYSSYESPGIDIFQGLKPDIVAIQEFRYNASSDDVQLRALVDLAFGTNFYYYREPYTGGGDLPNGIVSRWPILNSGSWNDPVLSNRGFAWAQIDLPGTNDLYLVSVHLYSSGSATDRNTEATAIKTDILNVFPADAWVVVAGDFNTDSRSEAAVTTFKTFLSDDPIPTDQDGNPNTSQPRSKPYDYLLPSFSFTNNLAPVTVGNQSFGNGLVFDSRVYTPLADVAPVQSTDSAASGMQHMGVVKDFTITYTVTNAPSDAPAITAQPQSQSVNVGDNATFTVSATGAAPLSYQWRFNSEAISGATSTAYTRTNVQPADLGEYTVVVTNSAGSVTSAVATLTLNTPPAITSQPQSRTNSLGQDAVFTVTATGTAPLSYQWRFNGNDISGADDSVYTRANVQLTDAGNYSVVITNCAGAITSAPALLTVTAQSQPEGIIAQWDFNSLSLDPSSGNGTASYTGGTAAAGSGEFATGSSTDPAPSGNSAWNTSSYPAPGTANKTAGVRFNVSTAGRQNIMVRWDQRASNTGSKYVRLQYTTNGSAFYDFPVPTVAATGFTSWTNDLSSFPGVNDNPNFAFRIVAEFESTAINDANNNYVAANPGSTYASTGTLRFDMVTVMGTAIPPANPAARPTLSAPAYTTSRQFQFTLTGTAGSNYVIQASTNLGSTNWVSLWTNAAPFTFVDTNANLHPQRFYRGLVAP